jgi:hypothetical protein
LTSTVATKPYSTAMTRDEMAVTWNGSSSSMVHLQVGGGWLVWQWQWHGRWLGACGGSCGCAVVSAAMRLGAQPDTRSSPPPSQPKAQTE